MLRACFLILATSTVSSWRFEPMPSPPARKVVLAQDDMPQVLVRSSRRPSLPMGKLTIPAYVRKVIHNIRPGTTRAQLRRLFAPAVGHASSDRGIVRSLGAKVHSVSERVNPQEFYYRFAHAPHGLEFGRSRKGQWRFGKWVFGREQRFGGLVMIKVTWRYSNNRAREDYRTETWFGHKVITAPVYDGVAGGSPDDVVRRISKPYLDFEPGSHG